MQAGFEAENTKLLMTSGFFTSGRSDRSPSSLVGRRSLTELQKKQTLSADEHRHAVVLNKMSDAEPW